jgi:DNA-binding MarR family transcriptional regulator
VDIVLAALVEQGYLTTEIQPEDRRVLVLRRIKRGQQACD